MRTIHRVSALAGLLNEMQSELARSRIDNARRLAAELAGQLESWRFDLMHIPPEERSRYETPNPYWYTKQEAVRA